ncbi:hypothetical protein NX09_10980 [Xanthomonas vasicola]|nr:hypothetical protein NX07_16135 [Xanthomonas vasicola]KGR55668.1 hypothetical protein NX09_10980 [Xanthomonas vasicola]
MAANAMNLADLEVCANPVLLLTAAASAMTCRQQAAAFRTRLAVTSYYAIPAAGVDHHAAGLASGPVRAGDPPAALVGCMRTT